MAVDCADRISAQSTDLDLRRVRMLRDGDAGEVTVRVFSQQRRFDITISNPGRAGPTVERSYSWTALEVAESGEPAPGGARLPASDAAAAEPDPESAYWAAVEAISGI